MFCIYNHEKTKAKQSYESIDQNDLGQYHAGYSKNGTRQGTMNAMQPI